MKCPHCDKDIKDCLIIQANARIVAKRRKRNGTAMTPKQARERQARGVAARLARKAVGVAATADGGMVATRDIAKNETVTVVLSPVAQKAEKPE